MEYKPVQKKNSSWTPTTVHKKGKSPGKLGHFSIQPKSNLSSAPSQEIGEYKRASADRLTANVIRGLQAKEQEQAEESTVQRKSESPWAPTFDAPPPLAQSPASQLKGAFAPVSDNPIQRQCADCAKEEEEQATEAGKDLEEIGIQTKLTVGAPGDPYEQEADRVASQVISMSAPPDSSASVQRQLDTNHPHHPHQIWKRAQSITPVVQRQIDPRVQMRQMIQRAAQIDGNQASGDLESRLNASKGGGSPLSEGVRGFMEPRFGADFSGVRVHTGGEAVQMNRELGAQAFAHGSDVYFGAGKEPGKNELTAHELTHVVQQTGVVQLFIPNSGSVSLQTNAQLKVQRANTYNDCTPAQRTAIQNAFNRARGKVNAAVTAVQTADSSHPTIAAHTRTLLNTHFHTTKKDDIQTILNRFRDIQRAFTAGVNFECETDCESGVQGYVYKFLFWHLGRVHICFNGFTQETASEQEAIIIHEVAHRFAGVGDKAYVYESDYASLSPKKAMDNADSYAYFAIQI
jgi:hypothetical protein